MINCILFRVVMGTSDTEFVTSYMSYKLRTEVNKEEKYFKNFSEVKFVLVLVDIFSIPKTLPLILFMPNHSSFRLAALKDNITHPACRLPVLRQYRAILWSFGTH